MAAYALFVETQIRRFNTPSTSTGKPTTPKRESLLIRVRGVGACLRHKQSNHDRASGFVLTAPSQHKWRAGLGSGTSVAHRFIAISGGAETPA